MGFWIIVGSAIYFAPAFIAWDRKNFARVALLNIFLGWTVVCWVLALVWALRSPENARADSLPSGK
jgi:hypothetical protein